MALRTGSFEYDRERTLKRARRAAKRGAHAKAARYYARLRQAEPGNPDILRRVASHRTRAGLHEEALRDCRVAAQALVRRGFAAQAIGIYREYTARFPHVEEAWRALADVEMERGRTPDAVVVLVEASRHFRARRRRAVGIELLKRARSLDPTHFEAGYGLADLVWRSGDARSARRLLAQVSRHARTLRDERRLRARLFRISPTPAAAWRWLRALLRSPTARPLRRVRS